MEGSSAMLRTRPSAKTSVRSLKSDQVARYKQLSKNILLTDYFQFIWLKDRKSTAREPIAFPHDLEGKPRKPRDDRVAAVSTLLRGFFSTAPEGIGRSEQLALALATRAHFLRDFLDQELRRQEKEHRELKLYGLYEVFRDQVFHELTLVEFADAFAQIASAGRWSKRISCAISSAAAWPLITAKVITRSTSYAIRRPSSPSPSTRRRSSRLCRSLSGTFTLVVIRSSTNTSNPAKAGSCCSARSTTSPKSPTRSPSTSARWRRTTTP